MTRVKYFALLLVAVFCSFASPAVSETVGTPEEIENAYQRVHQLEVQIREQNEILKELHSKDSQWVGLELGDALAAFSLMWAVPPITVYSIRSWKCLGPLRALGIPAASIGATVGMYWALPVIDDHRSAANRQYNAAVEKLLQLRRELDGARKTLNALSKQKRRFF